MSSNLSKKENFEMKIDNSVLILKSKFMCKIDNDQIIIRTDNELLPELKKEIIVKITNVDNINIDDSSICRINMRNDNKNIEISFKLDKFTDRDLIKYLKSQKHYTDNIVKYKLDKELRNHHYGRLIALSDEFVKNMTRNLKYIIVKGDKWSHDYDGSSSFAILEYNGYYIDNEKNTIDGIVYRIVKNKLFEQSASLYLSNIDGNYYTNNKNPVYVVIELRKRIKLHPFLCKI